MRGQLKLEYKVYQMNLTVSQMYNMATTRRMKNEKKISKYTNQSNLGNITLTTNRKTENKDLQTNIAL